MECVSFHGSVSPPRPQATCTQGFHLLQTVLEKGKSGKSTWTGPVEQSGRCTSLTFSFSCFSILGFWLIKWSLLLPLKTRTFFLGHIFNGIGIELLSTNNLLGFEFKEILRQSQSQKIIVLVLLSELAKNNATLYKSVKKPFKARKSTNYSRASKR